MATIPILSFTCPIQWNSMRGDERERYCSKCSRHVVNISTLTDAQRESLLAQARPGELCVAYYRRLSGEPVTAEKPLTRFESLRIVQAGTAALAIAAAAIAVNSSTALGETSVRVGQHIATTLSTVRNELVGCTEAIAEEISLGFGGSKQTPVYVTLGIPAVLPSPSSAASVSPRPAP